MNLLPQDPIKQLISIILFVIVSFALSYWYYRSCCKQKIEDEEYEYAFYWDPERLEYIKVRRPRTYYNPQLGPTLQTQWGGRDV